MYLSEQYTMYRLAYSFVKNNHFDVLHINEREEEIWLEKYENKTSHVIRFVHSGFDWKNHLKKDIAIVFQKVKAMKRLMSGKNIEIHNIYISSHSPVDDWESLKKPMLLKDKNPIKMNVYYFEKGSFDEERIRLFESLGLSIVSDFKDDSEVDKEHYVNHYKKQLANSFYDKRKEAESVFSHGKPFLTYLLLVVNVFMFLLLEINGGSESTETLVNFGAKYNPAILDGEWWRIISSMFLHIGFLHILMNMLAVYYLGIAAERIFGSWRFLIIYMLAGIGGGLASFAFTVNVSAGASGALFGLFGALLYFGLIYKKLFFQTMGKNLLIIIGINIVFGLSVPQIDNSAHIGGLVTGFLAAAIVGLPKKGKLLTQFGALIIYGVIIAGLVLFGIQNNVNSASYQLVQIEEDLEAQNYEAVVNHATKGLDNPEDLKGPLLFQRSFAYIQLGKTNLAIKDLEQVTKIKSDMPEAFYNLAMMYAKSGDQQLAIDTVKKAYELRPNDSDYVRLYEQITGEKPNK